MDMHVLWILKNPANSRVVITMIAPKIINYSAVEANKLCQVHVR